MVRQNGYKLLRRETPGIRDDVFAQHLADNSYTKVVLSHCQYTWMMAIVSCNIIQYNIADDFPFVVSWQNWRVFALSGSQPDKLQLRYWGVVKCLQHNYVRRPVHWCPSKDGSYTSGYVAPLLQPLLMSCVEMLSYPTVRHPSS